MAEMKLYECTRCGAQKWDTMKPLDSGNCVGANGYVHGGHNWTRVQG